jgi:CheY-like chemotaxis protein
MIANKKVLVVEDDADLRLGYRVLLRAHHYDTFFAEDGVSAVSEARKHQPDVTILDLGLPAGDGFVVLERFSANPSLANIPVVVVSGRDVYGVLGNRERAFKAGARAYLRKPWDDAELLMTISDLLGERDRPDDSLR